MKKLIKKLENPFDSVEKNDVEGFKNECRNIAQMLFNDYCIRCCNTNTVAYYYFAEIEFYYYDKDKFNDYWNWKTYPRTRKSAGEILFHYSGFDICFKSDFKDGKFGGILIRSLKDENGIYITGPSVCAQEVLNVCSKLKTWLEVVPIPNDKCAGKCDLNELPIPRYGIDYKDENKNREDKDKILKDKSLCFYDKKLFEKYTSEKENFERFENAKWDYDKKNNGENAKQKDLIRYYNRFKSINN